MDSTSDQSQKVAVIGAGKYGSAVANLLAENNDVLIYVRRKEVADQINRGEIYKGIQISPRVHATTDLSKIASECRLIFPMLPSGNFRQLMRELSPFLSPEHIIIHGTKGLDVPQEYRKIPEKGEIMPIHRGKVKTMSEIISQETIVVRVGCLSGPNLAGEINRGLPAGAVIASRFDEVIQLGKKAIESGRFKIYENHDLRGVELGGVLKNILAIGSGMISGLELGENARALMVTRGWSEIMGVAEMFGSDRSAFMGLAGIGDLIATCSSPMSRNYSVGYRIAKGEKIQEIIQDMDEIAEGVNTLVIARGLVREHKVRAPIITAFYNVLFEQLSIEKAIENLMNYPFSIDVDFL